MLSDVLCKQSVRGFNYIMIIESTLLLSRVFMCEFAPLSSVTGLTGLSSDTSHPRYSAACII